MKDYLREVFDDSMLSYITKKYGTSLNDDQRMEKANELFESLKNEDGFTIVSTQTLIEKKGFTTSYPTNCGSTSVFALVKEGMFHKVKSCYFITRTKDAITAEYLKLVFDELRRQANGENVFNSPDYKN